MKDTGLLFKLLALIMLILPACNMHHEEPPRDPQKIIVTSPQLQSVTIIQKYVCQIHSRRHILIRALERGYLEEIEVKEGQSVKQGDVLFKVTPIIYKAKFDAELAEQNLAQMQYNYAKTLADDKVVSKNEVLLEKAKLARAEANTNLAQAELNFTIVKAPFDGIVDRQQHQLGSLVAEGDSLTTLSDNSLMWVYFNVPEASYLEYMTELKEHQEDLKIELMLANGKKYPQIGKLGAIEADFNNRTGNIQFRADFENPDRLLRNGQTGTILIGHQLENAIVIPQRATFQILAKRYVYVVDKDHVAHQHEIEIDNELEDIYVIRSGVSVEDKIVLEGIRQVHDGDKLEYQDRDPKQVFANMKYHAE